MPQEQANHEITLQKAIEMTSRFRKEMKSIVQPDYASALPYAETFSKSVFTQLAAQPGCVSIRSYLGLDEKNNVRLIFVGVNDKNEDILPGFTGGGLLFEFGQRCPPICGVGPLNQ